MRPTCKAVVRAGQNGARIHPRGCQVRQRISADGSSIRRNKQGQIKRKIKTTGRELAVAVSRSGYSHQFIWDTGAVLNTCGVVLARRWGLLRPSGGIHATTGAFTTRRMNVRTANDQTLPARKFENVPITVSYGGHNYQITTDIIVLLNGNSLLGVNAIRLLRRQGLSVSFK